MVESESEREGEAREWEMIREGRERGGVGKEAGEGAASSS